MSKIVLIVAMADNGVIGANGHIPWRIAEDMQHFKMLTLGKPCVMGRKTWQSLPRKPLPGRTNIVVTRDGTFKADGGITVRSLDDAIARAEQENASEIMVIGGAEIYAAARSRADLIYLTEVHACFDGEIRMPKFSRDQWREVSRENRATDTGLRYSFVVLAPGAEVAQAGV